MAERKTTETQDAILSDIAKAVAAERAAEQAARIEADELIRVRTKEARIETNALVYIAERNHRITKSAIAKRGFGNTNRIAIDARIKEHEHRTSGYSGPVMHDAPTAEAQEGDSDQAVRVTHETDAYVVTLDRFTHEDVGENLSGEVLYNEDGSYRGADVGMTPAVQANPLLVMRLWGLEEVQAGVRDAE